MRLPHLLFLGFSLTLQAATYYVDSGSGNDVNTGTTQNSPWKSLEKVNATKFHPADRVLFRSGAAWQGQLILRGSGDKESPILISRYGSGTLPRIDAAGQFPDAIRLYNVQFIELRNLEVTNHGATPAARRGVHVFLDNFGTGKHIVIAGLFIHDVNGDNGNGDNGKDNGGIIFRTVGDKKPTRFDGLTIERNIVWKVDRSAIAAQSYHWRRTKWFPSLNVVIRDNFVDDIGGDGIVPWATDGAVIEHNIALNCNRRAGSYNAGIWPWSTDNSLFQLNEAAFTRTTLDGEGFDSDFNSRNTLFQYNYSHDNEGGFMLICTPGKLDKDNLGNLGTEVRYNISRNDRTRIVNLSAAADTAFHDNAIYVGPGIDLQMLIVTDWEGWADKAVFRNNFFYVQGIARYGHQASRNKDGTYGIAPGWGPARDIIFEGNHYTGRNIDRPTDPGAHNAAATPPKLDLEEPSFDPVHPELFDAFIIQHRAWIMRLFEQQFGKRPRLER